GRLNRRIKSPRNMTVPLNNATITISRPAKSFSICRARELTRRASFCWEIRTEAMSSRTRETPFLRAGEGEAIDAVRLGFGDLEAAGFRLAEFTNIGLSCPFSSCACQRCNHGNSAPLFGFIDGV